ncbi:hypothetical protein BBK36DRAFT_1157581 [Trichoderma citrinoviride]|uniref:Uncharacterized protein n=1 Tax=Trichoderma citrinoviride TaxID=58853 RepID=A0A2T4BEY8_9HYPO|nr:hypothetical protein BBK36DRAFT_1157581 [Trichoderma citrinoviride]PTB67900.1 hypothetical protein BBK36DRAFT_1157581 [Trichoderma citrinoviride]
MAAETEEGAPQYRQPSPPYLVAYLSPYLYLYSYATTAGLGRVSGRMELQRSSENGTAHAQLRAFTFWRTQTQPPAGPGVASAPVPTLEYPRLYRYHKATLPIRGKYGEPADPRLVAS